MKSKGDGRLRKAQVRIIKESTQRYCKKSTGEDILNTIHVKVVTEAHRRGQKCCRRAKVQSVALQKTTSTPHSFTQWHRYAVQGFRRAQVHCVVLGGGRETDTQQSVTKAHRCVVWC